jgi:hypothetical protein
MLTYGYKSIKMIEIWKKDFQFLMKSIVESRYICKCLFTCKLYQAFILR